MVILHKQVFCYISTNIHSAILKILLITDACNFIRRNINFR